ncbi:DUF2690 domain-containing protein [Streptomyces sp. cg40]|uniref:helix-turn-helix domain-containing protein n=1 Tax=Streptomyces sp. cg40 TaxID=3419764 RepID=UPI003D061A9A
MTVERQRLLAELHLLKRRTGLSLAALASVTPYSKSTWHRYLSGDQFPPRAAVEALARLAGTEPGTLLALWDTATREQSRPIEPPAPPVRPRRLRAPARALVALAAVATTVAVTAGAADVLDRDTDQVAFSCRYGGCQGELPSAGACARDARTESVVARATQVVRLRYSPSCATVWSEVRTRIGGAREISIRSGRDELSAEYPGDRSDGYSSPMLASSDPRGAQACAEVAGKPVCTAPGH